mmetsp:Transcript_20215/g.45987  ORF Transcript_20215/g.45987 Transcript_20215/m.45987 type:complete len:80 (-) Transcript_20215:379-618(-)
MPYKRQHSPQSDIEDARVNISWQSVVVNVLDALNTLAHHFDGIVGEASQRWNQALGLIRICWLQIAKAGSFERMTAQFH